MISAVVFDLDGTLLEFNLDYNRLRVEIIEFLHKQGLPVSLFLDRDRTSDIIKKAERFMLDNSRSEEINRIKKATFSIIDRFELDAARTTRLVSVVMRTLKALNVMSGPACHSKA